MTTKTPEGKWLIERHPGLIGRPWEQYDVDMVEGWIVPRTWSLFKSMKWGNTVLEKLIEWYSGQEEYEECRKIQLVIASNFVGFKIK